MVVLRCGTTTLAVEDVAEVVGKLTTVLLSLMVNLRGTPQLLHETSPALRDIVTIRVIRGVRLRDFLRAASGPRRHLAVTVVSVKGHHLRLHQEVDSLTAIQELIRTHSQPGGLLDSNRPRLDKRRCRHRLPDNTTARTADGTTIVAEEVVAEDRVRMAGVLAAALTGIGARSA
jgi:hypothetical protein